MESRTLRKSEAFRFRLRLHRLHRRFVEFISLDIAWVSLDIAWVSLDIAWVSLDIAWVWPPPSNSGKRSFFWGEFPTR